MATIQLSAQVKRNPGEVWKRVQAIDWPKHLTNMIHDVEVTGPDTRICHMQDGGKLVEKVVSTDNETRRQVYSVQESPFGLEHHNASMQVFSEDGGCSRVVWTTDVLPSAFADQMKPVLEGEFQTIVSRLSDEA
jgi:hypothetical protein